MTSTERTSTENVVALSSHFVVTGPLRAHLGMSAAEWKCLGLLRKHGSSSARKLAELSGFTTGAITGIVDRLERAGCARREPHPTDRRSVIVQLQHMKEVQQCFGQIFQSLLSAMATITSHYTAAELAAIAGFFRETTTVRTPRQRS